MMQNHSDLVLLLSDGEDLLADLGRTTKHEGLIKCRTLQSRNQAKAEALCESDQIIEQFHIFYILHHLAITLFLCSYNSQMFC